MNEQILKDMIAKMNDRKPLNETPGYGMNAAMLADYFNTNAGNIRSKIHQRKEIFQKRMAKVSDKDLISAGCTVTECGEILHYNEGGIRVSVNCSGHTSLVFDEFVIASMAIACRYHLRRKALQAVQPGRSQ